MTRARVQPQGVTERPRDPFCSGSRFGCTRDITDFGATRYRFPVAVVGIVDPGPPSHFNISLFRSLFPDDLDDVHSILLPPPWRNAFRRRTTNGDRRGDYRRSRERRTSENRNSWFETISKRDVPRAKRKRNGNAVYHRRSGIFPCPTGTGSLHRFAKGQKRRNRALWALRSRCSCRPDDEGRVALRHRYPVGAFY